MYQAIEILQDSGQAVLYRGMRDSDGQGVVIKVLGAQNRPHDLDRLKNEYTIGSALNIPAVIKPVALSTYDGRPALVMEDFRGELLDRRVGAPMETTTFLELAGRIAAAVADIHHFNVIHRDLRPANIAVHSETGAVTIIDFSLATPLPCGVQECAASSLPVSALTHLSPEQTGHVNRAPDQRSDLYGLGVTFYQMLTGCLPFDAKDPLEWLHCHIAQSPAAPAQRVPALPAVLSDIVLKLLAKEPEERYQTAEGLYHDLMFCLEQWRSRHEIAPFPLASSEAPDRFLAPQKLFGREAETAMLHDAFERVAGAGKPELVLVRGPSGIGKSALAYELYKRVARERGLFSAGKFSRDSRAIPYSALAQAFDGLLRNILAQSEERVAAWKARLQDALGANGQLLVDLIPALERVVGPQAPVPALPPVETGHRFRRLFRRFIGVFAQKSHPLALFLDDLQWADPASLALLRDVITHSDTPYLLLIGACRDDEAPGLADVVTIPLGPLTEGALASLVAGMLHRSVPDVLPLARVINEKTAGNPLFAVQLLAALHDARAIRFDRERLAWQWDIEQIRAHAFAGTIAGLLTAKLQQLPEHTQSALRQLACLGDGVPMATLASMLGQSQQQTCALLASAVDAGLLLRRGDEFRFPHDQMRDAACSLVPEEQRRATHQCIGHLLLTQLSETQIEERLFDIVHHLNQGAQAVDDAAATEKLRRLNLRAGMKARAATAYATASGYLGRAFALLPHNAWNNCYEDTFELCLTLCECEYLAGNNERADELFALLFSRVSRNLDHARVHTLRARLSISNGRFEEGVAAMLDALAQLGIRFPLSDKADKDLDAAVDRERHKIADNLGRRAVADLAGGPLQTDPALSLIAGLMAEILPYVFLTRPKLHALLLLKSVSFAMKYGQTEASCLAYGLYALELVTVSGDIDAGFQFSEMSLKLVERFDGARMKGPLLLLYANHVHFWRRPFAAGMPLLQQGLRACLESGDHTWAHYLAMCMPWHALAKGETLDEVSKQLNELAAFAQEGGNESIYRTLRLQQKFVAALKDGDVERFEECEVDQDDCISVLVKERFRPGIVFYHVIKQIIAFAHGRYSEALESARQAAAMRLDMRATPIEVDHVFYHALSLTALYPRVSAAQQQDFTQVLNSQLRKLKAWADHSPENFRNRYLLAMAEMARIEGRDLNAMRLYDEAIRSAAENRLAQHEALAGELAACFYRMRGLDRSADVHLRDAHACYLRWGAHGKAAQIEARYSRPQDAPQRPAGPAHPAGKQQIDVLSVVRAAKTLSGETVLENLLAKLIRIVIEQAGAQKAYVMLLRDNKLAIEAQALREADGALSVMLLRAATTLPSLPDAIIRHVWHSRQKLLLDDASQTPEFCADEYVAQTQPKSVLCQPIFRQAEAIGLLYLENNLCAGAFNPDVADVLDLFTSKTAISLEVARLSSELEEENAERHRAELDLQHSEARYRRLFEVPKDGVLLLDFETGRITSVNAFLIQMLGYGYTELLGKRLWEIGPFRKLAAYRLLFSELQDNDTVRYEYLPVQAKDGRTIDVEFASSVYELDNNKVIQCSIRAVTDRRRAEQRQAAQSAVTRVLAEAPSISKAAPQLLQVICENFGWELGELWRVDQAANLLRPLTHWQVAALASANPNPPNRHAVFAPERGLHGRVWRKGEAEWLADIMADPPAERIPYAEQIGLHGAFAAPVAVGGQVTHVMVFYSSQTRWADQEMIVAMTIIGAQIGQFMERRQTERALVESEERFRVLTNLSTDWYWEQDRNLRYTLVSEGLLHLQSFVPGDFLGKTREELPIDIESMGRAQWEAHQARIRARQPFHNLEYRIYDSQGRAHWFSINGAPLFAADGAFIGYRGTGKDITARKQAEELTVGQGKILEMIATGADLEMVLEQLVSVIAQQSAGMIGSILLLDEGGLHVRSIIAPALPASFARAVDGAALGPDTGSCGASIYRRERVITSDIGQDPLWDEYRDLAFAHGLRACVSTPILSQQDRVLGAFAMYYGTPRVPTESELGLADIASHIAGIAIERKQSEERIRHMAHHDELTGLPNRTLLAEHVKQAIAHAQKHELKVALLFIDLDHFKHINDSLGHQVGDHLLRAVARRLQRSIRSGDRLARLGGDEFLLTLPALHSDQDAAPIAQKLLDTLHQPFAVNGHELHVGGSIGISIYPGDGADVESLMRAADIAMYHAKEKGRGNYQYFTCGLNQAVQHRLRLANQLRHALARGELSMHYQPQVDMETGRIFAAEALVRWRQSELGYVPPAEFIPIAEETGLIFPVGEWVLQTACAQLKRWRDAGNSEMKIAVNLSARQVLQQGFADTVARILSEAGLPPSALDLEITESLLMQPSEENLAPLTRLSEMGIQLSVDDFGTGYSSLSYLKRFPIDALKIDQSFVRGIDRDQDGMTMVAAIIAMAQSLRLKVVAEGVETAAQGAFLREHGCLMAQGYFYSKPMPPEALSELLFLQSGLPCDRAAPPCLKLVPRTEK